MKLYRPRYSIRVLLVAIALTALNLAAGMASWRQRSEWSAQRDPFAHAYRYPQNECGLAIAYSVRSFLAHGPVGRDGELGFGPPEAQQIELREVSREESPRRPRILSLSPLLASLSITLLVILLPMVRGPIRRGRAPTEARREQVARSPRPPLAAGCLAIATSLIGLNLGAWYLHSPAPHVVRIASVVNGIAFPGESTFEDLFHGRPVTIVVRVDGRSETRRRLDGRDVYHLSALPPEQEQRRKQAFSLEEATIEFGSDDSIVTYGGTYDHKLSEPRVLRPARSGVKIWTPRIAALAITLFVLVYLGVPRSVTLPAWGVDRRADCAGDGPCGRGGGAGGSRGSSAGGSCGRRESDGRAS